MCLQLTRRFAFFFPLVIALLVVSLEAALAQPFRVQAAVEKQQVATGEAFAFQIQVEGSETPEKPDLAGLAEQLDPESYPDRDDHRLRIARAIQERITTFGGAARFLPQFYPPDPMSWTPEALEVLKLPDASKTLAAVHQALASVEEWDADAIIAAIRAAGAEAGVKGKKLFMPVRAAVSGSTQGPELGDIFEIQGRDTCLRVIEQARAQAG